MEPHQRLKHNSDTHFKIITFFDMYIGLILFFDIHSLLESKIKKTHPHKHKKKPLKNNKKTTNQQKAKQNKKPH